VPRGFFLIRMHLSARLARRLAQWLLLFFAVCSFGALADDHGRELSAKRYKSSAGRLGVVILEVNWGRQWNCADYENAQIQRLSFSQISNSSDDEANLALNLTIPSKLFVEDTYVLNALLVEPGSYAITGFDVKVARSVTDVGHMVAEASELIQDGEAIGGTFTINAGEIIYLGHFSLDCNEGIMPWRYYLLDRNEFERYVAMLWERFPYITDTPVKFRLFDTTMMGKPFSLENPVVAPEKKTE